MSRECRPARFRPGRTTRLADSARTNLAPRACGTVLLLGLAMCGASEADAAPGPCNAGSAQDSTQIITNPLDRLFDFYTDADHFRGAVLVPLDGEEEVLASGYGPANETMAETRRRSTTARRSLSTRSTPAGSSSSPVVNDATPNVGYVLARLVIEASPRSCDLSSSSRRG